MQLTTPQPPQDDEIEALRIGLAAGQARADLGGQRFGDLPAGVVGQGALAQLRGLLQGAVGDAGFGGKCQRSGAGQGDGKGGGGQGEAHGRLREASSGA